MTKSAFGQKVKTKWGVFCLGFSESGLTSVDFPNSRSSARSLSSAIAAPVTVRRMMNRASREFRGYVQGRQKAGFRLPLDDSEQTPAQRKVFKVLRRIPFGETRSYQWLAAKAGNPRAARAMGRIVGSNPVPVVVPCHRIIKASGALGGFSSGLGWKRRLLDHETH